MANKTNKPTKATSLQKGFPTKIYTKMLLPNWKRQFLLMSIKLISIDLIHLFLFLFKRRLASKYYTKSIQKKRD